MNVLDWVLVALVLAYAFSGYWQGFVVGAFSTVGLVLGGIGGIWLAPVLLGDAAPSLWVSLGALGTVLVTASVGQALLQFIGARIRETITWQPVRALDALGGAALSMAAVLLVSWLLGVAVSGSQLPGIGPQVRDSEVLARVDEVMPVQAQGLMRAFDGVVGAGFFPRYLEPFADERIVEVAPADQGALSDPQVVAAADSVLKVRSANRCGSGVEGTGFLYAPGKVMTNAHVVAGVDRPRVVVDGAPTEARLVVYDPEVDVAVLDVPGLDGPTLSFDLEGERGQQGAVLGFPQDGPYDAQAVRVRDEQRLRSPDIYGRGTVTREVLSLRGLVRPGNSGGPVVSTGGQVLGVVFAASVSDPDTGYALTSRQVGQAAAAGLTATDQVSSGECA